MSRFSTSFDCLQGLNVLVLPKNSRGPYFRSLLQSARQRYDWQMRVVCEPGAIAGWTPVMGWCGNCVEIPDFLAGQSWESDAAAVADIDAFIAACERRSNISAGRIVLAGERDLGRGFSRPIYYWFYNDIAKAVLADNRRPFVIVRRMFAFARATLQTARPDLVLAGEWANALHFVFYLVAQEMGIPCVVNRFSKIWSGRAYWSTDPLMYNDAARRDAAERRRRNAPISNRALERLRTFRAGPATLGYVKKNWDDAERQNWLAEQIQIARPFVVNIRHGLTGRRGQKPKPAWQLGLDFYRRRLLKWRQAKFFQRFDDTALKDKLYLLIALHKDPEQALNHQAAFWSNQLNTVALLCAALPAGYSLLVREHRLNAGRRPSAYYREMSRFPGVALIDAFDDQYKYIANADLVVTDNGSVGWEGLLLNRRVITLAANFFEGASLATRVRDPERLAEIVVDMLEAPAVKDPAEHDCNLGWLMDAEWGSTMPLAEEDYSETFAHLERQLSDDRAPRARSA